MIARLPNRYMFGHESFHAHEIQMLLQGLSLAPDSPLSVLAVEVLPPQVDQILRK
jgi:hypothetical protein